MIAASQGVGGKARALFVIGCPRSGTTLLARILNSHPSVLMTNETAVFLMLAHDIAKSREGIASGLTFGKEYYELWSDHLTEHARPLIESFYDKIRAVEGKQELSYWGEKHPHLDEHLDFVSSLYPDARYIYLIRDPRDVACSISSLIGAARDSVLESLKPAVERYEAFARNLDATRLLRIRYEDLITDYQWIARHLFSWLELECTDEVERLVLQWRGRDSHNPLAADGEVDFKSRSMGRWRREFDQTEKQLAEELFEDHLRQYRYHA